MLFELGTIVYTLGIMDAMESGRFSNASLVDILSRHSVGYWGDVPASDKKLNDEAVEYGGRLVSAYQMQNGLRVLVITEGDRSATTILLPEEY